MRGAFVRPFEGSYTRATTIEHLERCVQGPLESTHIWVQRWQDLWYNAVGIHPDTAIHCFKNSCRYEPLVAKLKQHSRTLDNIPDLLEIAKRYTEEDPNQETDDESGGQRRTNGNDNGRRSNLRYSNTRLTGKRRSDGRVDFVAKLGTRSASPRASAVTEGNAATAATTRRNQGSTPRPSLTNLVRFTVGKGSPPRTRPPTATLSGRLRRHGERGRTPTTIRQTTENSAMWPARSTPSQASTRSA